MCKRFKNTLGLVLLLCFWCLAVCPYFQQFLRKAVLSLSPKAERFASHSPGISEALESPETNAKTLAPAKDLKHDKQSCLSPTPPTGDTQESNLHPHPTGVSVPSSLFKDKLISLLLGEDCRVYVSDVECEGGTED